MFATGSSDNWSVWIFLGVLLVGGAALFNALDSSREQGGVLSVFHPAQANGAQITAPPPLHPPERFSARLLPRLKQPSVAEPTASLRPAVPLQIPSLQPSEPARPALETVPTLPRSEPGSPRVVFESQPLPTPQVLSDISARGVDRCQAGKLTNPSLTTPQGTVNPAVLDTGVGLAVTQATDRVIVALPGSTQNVRKSEPERIQPTLRVRHGTSVSVLVARDLDFSTVEQ